MLNQQTIVGQAEEHGTAVSSVVGAPVNGVGIVGVYPQAVLRAFDASPSTTRSTTAAVIQGIDPGVAGRARRDQPQPRGPGRELLDGAGDRARVRARHDRGRRGRERVPKRQPALVPGGRPARAHRRRDDDPTTSRPRSRAPRRRSTSPRRAWTSRSRCRSRTTRRATRRSTARASRRRSSPARRPGSGPHGPTLEKTQVYDLMRWSAKDIWDDGWDKDTGFGLLDIPAALGDEPAADRPAGAERRPRPGQGGRALPRREAAREGGVQGPRRLDRRSRGRLPRRRARAHHADGAR